MTTWFTVAGDEGAQINVTLNGVSNLGDASAVEAHVWLEATSVTLAAEINDDETGALVSLGSWLADLAPVAEQSWNFEVQVDWPASQSLTWPDSNPDTIVVRPQAPAP